MNNNRIEWIDFAKGIIIFSVVFGHVTLGIYYSIFFLEYKQSTLLIYKLIQQIRMPLFFIVAGFFYFPEKNNDLNKLGYSIKKKFISLGIPYLIFSIFTWITKFLMGNNVNRTVDISDLFLIFIKPIDTLWFLYALLVIFIVMYLLDYFIKNKVLIFSALLIITIISWYYKTGIYIVDKIVFMSIFFYCGKFVKQHLNTIKEKSFFITCILIYIVLQTVNFTFDISYMGFDFLVSIVGIFTIIGISMNLSHENKIFIYFSQIGTITMPIYLLHPPIASAARMFLLKIDITNIFAHYILGMLAAWFISIYLYKFISRYKYGDFIFYPWKYLNSKQGVIPFVNNTTSTIK